MQIWLLTAVVHILDPLVPSLEAWPFCVGGKRFAYRSEICLRDFYLGLARS